MEYIKKAIGITLFLFALSTGFFCLVSFVVNVTSGSSFIALGSIFGFIASLVVVQFALDL